MHSPSFSILLLSAVPVDSPCYGMSGTCCLRSNEKSMVPVVQLEYHNKLEEALKKRLTSCGTMGRRFERKFLCL